MELLKKVILSACFLSIVISLVDSVKPGEKFARQLKLIFSMIFILGIVVSAVNADFKLELPIAANADEIGEYESISKAADKAVLSSAEKSVNDMACRILTSHGIKFEKITSDINMNSDGSININEIGYSGDDYDKACSVLKSNMGEIEVKKIE